MSKALTLLLLVISPLALSSEIKVYTSTSKQTSLIELYTSEGCSSCPVADKWISEFRSNPKLWQDVIPLAFHVDYWNYLGWKDKFAKPNNSERQRLHQRQGHIDSVYTPGFVIDGKEWRGFFNPLTRAIYPKNKREVGILILTKDNHKLDLELNAIQVQNDELIANIAYLATDIAVPINGGENKGKTLKHNFVVLKHATASLKRGSGKQKIYHWTIRQKAPKNATAIAAWISSKKDLSPIQAVAGWL